MSALFKNKTASERKSIRYPILLNEEEAGQIRSAANDRQLSVAEFIRRAALGRKADVNYEVDAVLALLKIDRLINSIGTKHQAMIERGITPSLEDWRPVKNEIRLAMVKIAERQPYDFS